MAALCPKSLSNRKKRKPHRITVRDNGGHRRRYTVTAFEFAEFENYALIVRRKPGSVEADCAPGFTCWRDEATQRLVFKNEDVTPGVRIPTMTGILLAWLRLYHPSAPYLPGGIYYRPPTMAEMTAA